MDPEVQLLTHRVRALRREAVKTERVLQKAEAIRSRYESWHTAEKEARAEIERRHDERKKQKTEQTSQQQSRDMPSQTEPRGPIGLLMQELEAIGAELAKGLVIRMDGEQDLCIMSTPFQALDHEVSRRAEVARARRTAVKSEERERLGEIDREADKKAKKSIAREDMRWLRKTQAMSSWGAEEIRDRIDSKHDSTCRHCGEAPHSREHVIWDCRCPRIREARHRAAPALQGISKHKFPKILRAGVPPAMHLGDNITYWGHRVTWEQRVELTGREREAMGLEEVGPKGHAARALYRWHGGGEKTLGR